MTTSPLAILQCRMNSTRLQGKVLLPLGGESIVARIWRTSCSAFGSENVVVAYPATNDNAPILDELRRIGAVGVAWDGDESDVLGRFYLTAHRFRWHPDAVLVRVTCDDPFKDIDAMRRVASGERLPVELGGEAFTLAMLDEAHAREPEFITPEHPTLGSGRIRNPKREHITDSLFPFRLPAMNEPGMTIDTEADYEAAKKRMAA